MPMTYAQQLAEKYAYNQYVSEDHVKELEWAFIAGFEAALEIAAKELSKQSVTGPNGTTIAINPNSILALKHQPTPEGGAQ